MPLLLSPRHSLLPVTATILYSPVLFGDETIKAWPAARQAEAMIFRVRIFPGATSDDICSSHSASAPRQPSWEHFRLLGTALVGQSP